MESVHQNISRKEDRKTKKKNEKNMKLLNACIHERWTYEGGNEKEIKKKKKKIFVSRNDFLNMSPSSKGIKIHILMVIDK